MVLSRPAGFRDNRKSWREPAQNGFGNIESITGLQYRAVDILSRQAGFRDDPFLPAVGDNTARQTDQWEIEERAENPVILLPIPLCVATTWPF